MSNKDVVSFDFDLSKADKIVHPDGSLTFNLKKVTNDKIKPDREGQDNKD